MLYKQILDIHANTDYTCKYRYIQAIQDNTGQYRLIQAYTDCASIVSDLFLLFHAEGWIFSSFQRSRLCVNGRQCTQAEVKFHPPANGLRAYNTVNSVKVFETAQITAGPGVSPVLLLLSSDSTLVSKHMWRGIRS